MAYKICLKQLILLIFSVNEHVFFVVPLSLRLFQNGSKREHSLCSFKKSTIRHDSAVRKRRGERGWKERRIAEDCLSLSSSSCREDQTGGERLKTEGSGTSWPGGDDSISFSSSFLPTEAFREGIERTTGDSQRKGKNVSNVTCGSATFLIALPVFNYLALLLWKTYLLSF